MTQKVPNETLKTWVNQVADGGLFYFAHPYTAKDEDGNYVPEAEEANFQLCCQRSARLIEAGYNIYSPICHTHPIHRASPLFLSRHEHEVWYRLDNEFIDSTEWKGIILAPLWEQSIGCMAEYKRFIDRGLLSCTWGQALLRAGAIFSDSYAAVPLPEGIFAPVSDDNSIFPVIPNSPGDRR